LHQNSFLAIPSPGIWPRSMTGGDATSGEFSRPCPVRFRSLFCWIIVGDLCIPIQEIDDGRVSILVLLDHRRRLWGNVLKRIAPECFDPCFVGSSSATGSMRR